MTVYTCHKYTASPYDCQCRMTAQEQRQALHGPYRTAPWGVLRAADRRRWPVRGANPAAATCRTRRPTRAATPGERLPFPFRGPPLRTLGRGDLALQRVRDGLQEECGIEGFGEIGDTTGLYGLRVELRLRVSRRHHNRNRSRLVIRLQ